MSEHIKDVSMEDVREADNQGEDRRQERQGYAGELVESFSEMKLIGGGNVPHNTLSNKTTSTLIFDYDDDIPVPKREEAGGDLGSASDMESLDEGGEMSGQQGQESGSGGELTPQLGNAGVGPQGQSQSEQISQETRQYVSMMVPVQITWQQGGTKVYVTGSFTGWRKMIGLVPDANQPNLFRIKLQLPPGTHRFRFIVDNELRFSDFLPTATDQMGNFVNYLEIAAVQPPPQPAPIYEADTQAQQQQYEQQYSQPIGEQVHREANDRYTIGSAPNEQHVRESVGSAARGSTQSREFQGLSARSKLALQIEKEPDDMGDGYSRFRQEVTVRPKFEFTQEIPAVFTDPSVMSQYYLTLDQQQNNQQNFAWLTPPQLPPHLEHVILNMYNKTAEGANENTSGALPIPNHVVLNHLATSSIKHNTLCVASTVRYKRKYATQILYAPLQ
ncbi:HGR107Wp [Eremothecium sinecaudum]|uniref:HGR107Wp n=1 Tax=Eremothecium sinecaudum TaxID=45286 RepID=A0A0X8HVU8_9SACH|nr:HGR107Wp [Eremothecium sinecaudum]AMD22446.1 HGR107Wp [Eremothecium sinecaudum]